ncbi:hexokinase-2-like isoform X2 [Xenia sp. Carnegie-2017]|uniref:hexokinase-2-like isoform X2 n=1 Tax=Xenia sp. Carnegie-2017 TaxID=2897299 RepID=UPI001F03D210|nr:hexokinase-2-like isoform X2 [Xenia sp. Carnegie-2017]
MVIYIPWMKNTRVEGQLAKLTLSKDDLIKQMKLITEDMNNGLAADEETRLKSSIAMLVTYVRNTPSGKESGDFLALDLGGTNFRVLLISIEQNHITMDSKVMPMSKDLMTSDAVTLFDYIAECICNFVKEKNVQDKVLPLGFTFSFPVKMLSLTSGVLVKWTKGFTASGVENKDVVVLLKEALLRKKEYMIEIVGLVNDTTGTLMSCAWEDQEVTIGLILGTGTNACYMERLENVAKWTGKIDEPKQVIINTEWGAFGDNGSLDWIRTEYDREVDANSLNPGNQIFEKMISGMYLGEIVRLVCVHLISKGLLFGGLCTEKIAKRENFLTKYVSDIESGQPERINKVLQELGYDEQKAEDVDRLKQICHVMSERAARLASAGLAAIVKKIGRSCCTIAVDGSLFKKHPKFKTYMESTLSELLPGNTIKLMLSEDGSGKGAALVAAVASQQQT